VIRKYHDINPPDWVFKGEVTLKTGEKVKLTRKRMDVTPIRRHIKIKSEATPYDPAFKEYFEKRKINKGRNTWFDYPNTVM
jgi:RNA-directed DNA polymerase